MRRARLRSLLAAPALLLACTAPAANDDAMDEAATRREVEAALQRYQAAARTVNPDSVAAFYAPAAILFEPGIEPIQTRDSIRAFMGSFPGVRVDSATATPDTHSRPRRHPEPRDDVIWGQGFSTDSVTKVHSTGKPVDSGGVRH